MKRFFTLLTFLSLAFLSHAQLLITEISYNPPESGNDSLEYIEIYNSGAALDVTGYTMQGVDYIFDGIMQSQEILVIAIKPSAMQNVFGIVAEAFTGALSNGGETVAIYDASNVLVTEVIFDDIAPWPTIDDGTDGNGASIVLCDFDNPSLPESWKVSGVKTGVIINNFEVLGSPGVIEDLGCDGGPTGIIITTSGLKFVPDDITINVGEKITFTNGGGNHNANGSQSVYPGNPESFTSGPPSSDAWVYEYTFNVPGIYNYQCDLHVGAGMIGKITVLPPVDNSDIRLTEVFYNSGNTPDSLEFIEIYNNGTSVANLLDYKLTATSVDFVLTEATVNPGEYFVLCKDINAFKLAFGNISNVMEWGEGTLNNSGDNIIIFNANNQVIVNVTYDDTEPWPTSADGFGTSLILCDPAGNFDLTNIKAATFPEYTFNGQTFMASPGVENYCDFKVIDVTTNNADGISTNLGINAILEGTVYGINFRPAGLQFTLIDSNGDGIGTYSDSQNFGYDVKEGDVIKVFGEIGQFNGLAQILLDDVLVMGTQALISPTIVTSLDESTESQLVTIQNVMLSNPSQWTSNAFGFNVDVTDGTNTYNVRIDNDVIDIIAKAYPSGTFDITGLGGQFDSSLPYADGYQLLPRYVADINPFVEFVNTYPPKSIGEVTGNDANGVATSDGQFFTLEGTVYGVNLRPSGLSFTIIDDLGDGINVFNGTGNFGYSVAQGDKIQVKGVIDQFNGLTEIIPDSIFLLNSGSPLQAPLSVSILNETTESQYITIEAELVNNLDWLGDGTTFTVVATDGTNNFDIVIDNDTELSTFVFPNKAFKLNGIGSQRDVSEPFTEGYRIIPNFIDDFTFIDATIEIDGIELSVFPNPTADFINIGYNGEINKIDVISIDGQILQSVKANQIDVSSFVIGKYILKIYTDKGDASLIFFKIN